MPSPFPAHEDLEKGKEDARSSWMTRIQAGDHAALEEVLAEYWEPLVRYSRSFLGSRDAAEDAAQETFVRLWRHRNEWCASESIRAYLYRILHNHLLNERRARKVRARWRDQAVRRKPRGPATPIELAERSELSDAVKEALAALPPRRREVFTLARFHGLSYAEIAEVLNVSPQTVANQMSAALSTLRDRLSPFLANSGLAHLRLLPDRRN